jgi:hypothetical protein
VPVELLLEIKKSLFCESDHSEQLSFHLRLRHGNARNGANPMRTTTFLSVTAVVLAFLIVAHSRTVGLTTGSPLQNTMSIYDLDVGHPNMKNLPVQEIPLP